MRILIATDGSEFSRFGIEETCRIVADPANTIIKIVSTYQIVVPLDIPGTAIEYAEQLQKQARTEAEIFVAQGGRCRAGTLFRIDYRDIHRGAERGRRQSDH